MSLDEGPRRLVTGFIVAGTLARLVLASVTGLGVDESYTVAVARSFSLSYFDHPPLAFWLAGAVSRVAGRSDLLLRLPFILLFAGTTWLVFRLGARLFDERAGAYGALALNLAPFFTLSAGSWIVPDGPLAFFLVASTYCLSRALAEPEQGLGWWTAAGAAGGCAGLSKYVAVFAALGVFGFLATSDARRWLKRPGAWVALLVALVVTSPVFVWNATHDWASFRFQGGHTGVARFSGVHPGALVASLGAQAFYFMPWIWFGLLVVLVLGFKAGPKEKSWLLAWLGVGPIAALAVLALGGHPGLPHWAAGGYVLLFPLLGAWVARHSARLVRFEFAATVAVLVVLLAAFGVQASTGALGDAVPGLFRQGDPTLELVDWRELEPLFGRLGVPGIRAFAGAADWIAAGKLGYALGPSVPVLCLGGAPHHFAYLYDETRFRGQDALLVARPTDQAAREVYAKLFREVDSVTTVTIYRGRPAFDLTVLIGRSFSPPADASVETTGAPPAGAGSP